MDQPGKPSGRQRTLRSGVPGQAAGIGRLSTGLLAAAAHGRICAVAAAGQRDLQRCAAGYHDLFPAYPFDGALLGAVALANAFSAPWFGADPLRIVNRTTLWAFGVDWLIDYRATSRREVRDIVKRCLGVADGEQPSSNDSLTRFLAELRDELARAPAFDVLRPVWREELRLMLDAMALEWEWKTARNKDGRVPSFDDYVDNADNLGSSFVNISHWIFTDGLGPLDGLDDVRAMSQAAQRVIRLLNDLGTYQRDLAWGDLNALMLGPTHADVVERIGVLLKHCQERLEPMRVDRPRLAEFTERQMGFCIGFYEITDYWGEL